MVEMVLIKFNVFGKKMSVQRKNEEKASDTPAF